MHFVIRSECCRVNMFQDCLVFILRMANLGRLFGSSCQSFIPIKCRKLNLSFARFGSARCRCGTPDQNKYHCHNSKLFHHFYCRQNLPKIHTFFHIRLKATRQLMLMSTLVAIDGIDFFKIWPYSADLYDSKNVNVIQQH